ncbi:MAG: hypothetical protein ACTS43_00580 [Candidatus Hodgkinia cicadicola]
MAQMPPTVQTLNRLSNGGQQLTSSRIVRPSSSSTNFKFNVFVTALRSQTETNTFALMRPQSMKHFLGRSTYLADLREVH